MTPTPSTEVTKAKRSYKNDNRAGRADTRAEARALKRAAKQILKAKAFDAVTYDGYAPMHTVADAETAFTYAVDGNSRVACGKGLVFAKAIGVAGVSLVQATPALTELTSIDVSEIVNDLKRIDNGESILNLYNA